MARARAGMGEARITKGIACAKVDLWAQILVSHSDKDIFRLNAQASAEASRDTLGAKAEASLVKV